MKSLYRSKDATGTHIQNTLEPRVYCTIIKSKTCNREWKRNKDEYCATQTICCCCFLFVWNKYECVNVSLFMGELWSKMREMFGLQNKVESTGNDWRTLFLNVFSTWRAICTSECSLLFFAKIKPDNIKNRDK